MKRPYLLLEILIAIFVVSICLVPLIHTPIQSFQAELHLLEAMEQERLADWTFSEIKEIFLKNGIPWKRIPGLQSQSGPFPLPPATIHIPGCSPKQVERSFTLLCGKKGEKVGADGQVYRLLRVDIHFQPQFSQKQKVPYRLLVRKLPRTVVRGSAP